MLKKEIIWREILESAIHKKQYRFTQKDIAKKLSISVSTVFNALLIPRKQGAITVSGRDFSLIDIEKLLYIWATQRNLAHEILYQTAVPMSAKEIEGSVPSGIIFGGCSAYAYTHKSAPAEYDTIYVYASASELLELKKRFPKQSGKENIFVLKKDPLLERYGNGTTPDTQTFADLWNMKEWYAKDFLLALKNRIIPS